MERLLTTEVLGAGNQPCHSKSTPQTAIVAIASHRNTTLLRACVRSGASENIESLRGNLGHAPACPAHDVNSACRDRCVAEAMCGLPAIRAAGKMTERAAYAVDLLRNLGF